MAKKSLDKWTQAANELTRVRRSFSVPMHVIIAEAIHVARFLKTYWDPVPASAGVAARPGMSSVVARLPSTIADDLVEQAEALQAAQTHYVLTVSPISPQVRARADFLVSELSAALEFLFDDGVEDESDRQLLNIKQTHATTPDSIEALAAELADYAELANRHAEGLAKVAGMDEGPIAEARELVRSMRERESGRSTPQVVSDALEKRDRTATLVVDNVARIRAAARYVFRNHPDILRQAASAYERRRRAESRRRTTDPVPDQPSGPSPQPSTDGADGQSV